MFLSLDSGESGSFLHLVLLKKNKQFICFKASTQHLEEAHKLVLSWMVYQTEDWESQEAKLLLWLHEAAAKAESQQTDGNHYISAWLQMDASGPAEAHQSGFKPSESRSMVLKKGKVAHEFLFFVDGTVRPSIIEKPVSSHGKVFDCSLRDTASAQATINKLEA